MLVKTIAIILLASLLVSSPLSSSIDVAHTLNNSSDIDRSGDAWNLWLKTYRVVAEISRLGGKPDKYVDALNETYRLIKENKTSKAYIILEETYREAHSEYLSLQQGIIYRRILYYLPVIGILSIPLIFHILFPRIYLALWFRARRDWVVEE